MDLKNLPAVKTVTRKLSYYDSRVVMTTIHHDKSSMGLRTVRMEWLDTASPKNGGWPAGSTVEKVIKGDGRNPDRFVEYVPEHLVNA